MAASLPMNRRRHNARWHDALRSCLPPIPPYLRFRNLNPFKKDHEQPRTRPHALGELLTTGMGIRKRLDALVNNLFKGNATVIGEWATASHVERQGTRKAKRTAGGANTGNIPPKP